MLAFLLAFAPHKLTRPLRLGNLKLNTIRYEVGELYKFLAVTLVLGTLSQPLLVQADFNDGVVALMTGDHDTALATLVPLAETSDHGLAQYFLGRMYAEGRGVKQDSETAAKWFRKSAEHGVQDAQYRLATMYAAGDGVPKDVEYAYGWYRCAAHLGNAKAEAAAAAAKELLSPEELRAAESLSTDLIQKYGQVSHTTLRAK